MSDSDKPTDRRPVVTRTYSDELRAVDFNAAVDALQLQGKNIVNTTLYIIRNVLSALEADGSLKATLVPQQQAIIAEVNLQVTRINAARRPRHAAKLLKYEPGDKPVRPLKLLRAFGAADPAERAKALAILDLTLLDNVVRAHRDQDGFGVYGAVPASLAQYLIRRVIKSFKGYFETLASYKRTPGRFTGRPVLPGYLGRHERTTIGFTAQCLQKTASCRFVDILGKPLYTDYAKTVMLSDARKAAFASFDLQSTLTRLTKRNNVPASAALCEVRLVPLPGGRIRIEAVYEAPLVLPAGCLAQTLLHEIAVAQPDLKASLVNKALLERLWALPPEHMPRAASIDPGLNNFVTLGYSIGSRATILSNDRLEQKIASFDAKIDQRKSVLMTPALRGLQVRHRKKELSKAELAGFKKELAALHRDPALIALQQARCRWIDDAMHKVSSGIVQHLVRRRIQVLVIGLNQMWKNEVNMGRVQNRRMLATAHTKLAELLQYKCLQAGILVVTTEESFTSRTSFALHEPLQKYGQPASDQVPPAITAPRLQDIPAAPAGKVPEKSEMDKPQHMRVPLAGRRCTGKRRHFFASPGLPEEIAEKWATIHADANGCLNILRKVFRHFKRTNRVNSGFWLAWLSPKHGLTSMRLRTG